MAVHASRPLFKRLKVVKAGRRRRWTENEKLRIMAESLGESRQVFSTASRHGISRPMSTCRYWGGFWIFCREALGDDA
jgi:transposase